MTLPDEINEDKLAEVALAMLWLTAHGESENLRVWKGFDWDLMNLLHHKGWTGDPVGKQKSVALSNEGAKLAESYFEKYFSNTSE